MNEPIPTPNSISLRQWYAGQAMAAILARSDYTDGVLAMLAFKYADAMIDHEVAERNRAERRT